MRKYYFERRYRTRHELEGIFKVSERLDRFRITKSLVIGKNNKILDIGCGAGYLSKILEGRYTKYVGTDLLEKNLEIARMFYKNEKTTFTSEDIFADKRQVVKDKCFDYVFMLELIEHVDNPGDYIRQCLKLLKKNGYLIISTPNATCITNILWNIKNANRIVEEYSVDGTETDHVCVWDKQTLQNLLARNGMKIIDIRLSRSTIRGGQSVIVKAQKVA